MNILEELESLEDFYYSGSFELGDSTFLAILMGILGIVLFFAAIMIVLRIVGQWKVFKKAGEKGWKALIPIYDTYTMCKLVGVSPWWVLIELCVASASVIFGLGLLSSVVSLYFSALVAFSTAKSYGKEDTYGIGLFFLYPIFILILGCGSAEYIGPRPIKDIIFNKNGSDDTEEVDVSEEKVEEKKTDNKKGKGKYCSSCGNELTSKDKYCSNCGRKI